MLVADFARVILACAIAFRAADLGCLGARCPGRSLQVRALLYRKRTAELHDIRLDLDNILAVGIPGGGQLLQGFQIERLNRNQLLRGAQRDLLDRLARGAVGSGPLISALAQRCSALAGVAIRAGTRMAVNKAIFEIRIEQSPEGGRRLIRTGYPYRGFIGRVKALRAARTSSQPRKGRDY